MLVNEDKKTERKVAGNNSNSCDTAHAREEVAGLEKQIGLLKKEQSELYEVFERYVKFHEKVASLHSVRSLEDISERLSYLLRDIQDFTVFQVLLWDSSRRCYNVLMSQDSEGKDRNLACEQSLIDWALDNKTVSQVPLDDDSLLSDGINGVVIVPLNGREGKLGALLLWGDYDSNESKRFMVQMLDILSKVVGGIFDNLILSQKSRRTTLLMDGIIESVPHAIIAIDGSHRLLACNSNAEFMFNFRRIFALDEPYSEVLPQELVPVISSLIASTISGKHEIDYETEHTLADGMRITIGISTSSLLDREGNAQGVLLICRDLSLSREVQKLRELDRLKDEFVHTVSHELKTPLTSILGCSEILLEIRDSVPQDYHEIIDILLDNAERLKELIADLLDMSRLQTGRMVLDKQPCDARAAVDEIVGTLEGNKNGCTLVVNSPEDLPMIEADYEKIKQVFQNVIGNAVKYSPGGGEVRIDIKHTGREIVVNVSDQGLGIPKDQLPFVFDKFFRVDSSTTTSIEGTGLGLSIAGHIVELHNGTIHIESTEGKGSTFSIVFPAA
ncbi:MAG: ATP-binding protein [Planctomycetota bacterium]